MTTLQSMQALLKANFDLSPDVLGPTAMLEDLAIDSLAVIELMFDIEDKFNITVPSDPTAMPGQIKTVGDLVALVDRLIDEQSSAPAGMAGAT
jgi:acyl carrier protein